MFFANTLRIFALKYINILLLLKYNIIKSQILNKVYIWKEKLYPFEKRLAVYGYSVALHFLFHNVYPRPSYKIYFIMKKRLSEMPA